MQIDIIIFAVISLLLALKLKSILGTKNDEQDNIATGLALNEYQQTLLKKIIDLAPAPVTDQAKVELIRNTDLLKGDTAKIGEGIAEIAAVDGNFSADDFIDGARMAFEMIVEAFAAGDCDELKQLLSPKLYNDFEASIKARSENDIQPAAPTVNSAHIIEAHLGGVMAYVTVEYNTSKADGNIVTDIWTFARDTRSEDPNWILIETRTV